jgi:hypothetical protein
VTNRTYSLLIALIGVICAFVIIRSLLFADSLTLRNDLVQGFFVGGGLVLVTVADVSAAYALSEQIRLSPLAADSRKMKKSEDLNDYS